MLLPDEPRCLRYPFEIPQLNKMGVGSRSTLKVPAEEEEGHLSFGDRGAKVISEPDSRIQKDRNPGFEAPK